MKTWLMRRPVRRPVSSRDDRAQELVRVEAAFHQQLRLALANQLHGLGRRGMAVWRIDDPGLAEIDAVAVAISWILAAGPTRIGAINPSRPPRWLRPMPLPRRDARPPSGPPPGSGISPAVVRICPFRLLWWS